MHNVLKRLAAACCDPQRAAQLCRASAILRAMVLLFLMGAFLPSVSRAAIVYNAPIDLGPGGASGISSDGRVVGRDQNNLYHAFLWQNGVRTNLGTLPGGATSIARAVNALGQVVGFSDITAVVGEPQHAFLWLPTPAYGLPAGMNDLGTLPGGGNSIAFGINDFGQVSGESETGQVDGSGNPITHAFLWQNGVWTDLGTLPGGITSTAWAINGSGQAAGSALLASGVWHPALWQNGSVTDLGTLGGANAFGRGLNGNRQVVGESALANGSTHAFLWLPQSAYGFPAGINDLGTFSKQWPTTEARAINATGTVVGYALQPANPIFHAWVWTSANGMRDLNTLIPARTGWTLQTASGINDAGQVVGGGSFNGQNRAFLLTPR